MYLTIIQRIRQCHGAIFGICAVTPMIGAVPLEMDGELYGVFNVISEYVDGLSVEARTFVLTMSRYASLVLTRQRH